MDESCATAGERTVNARPGATIVGWRWPTWVVHSRARKTVVRLPNMRSRAPAGLAHRALALVVSIRFPCAGIHLPAPLRSRPVTALHRYYERSDSCPALSLRAGLPDYALRLPAPLSPTTSSRPRGRFLTLPLSSTGLPLARVWASPFTRWLAGRSGRIEFVILRMGGSPPVALHPALLRRSYLRFQAGERMPGGDLHPSDKAPSQAHSAAPWRRFPAPELAPALAPLPNPPGFRREQAPGFQSGSKLPHSKILASGS